MNLIAFLSEGAGFALLLAGSLLTFLLLTVLTLRSSQREHAGRILFPVFFIELALLFFVLAIAFPQSDEGVGPAVVPLLWIAGIFGLSVLLLVRAVLGFEEKDPAWGRIDIVAAFIGMTVLYLVLMHYIGYFVTTFLYIILSVRYLKYNNWKVVLPLAAGWILFSYVAFFRLLYVPLPQGTLLERLIG